MPPTSSARRPQGTARKAGFTLLEMIVTLAVMSLAVALVLPRAAGALDKTMAQVVLFDFQRQVMALRAEAFREETALELQDGLAPGAAANDDSAVDPELDPRPAHIKLAGGWSYHLSQPMRIEATGACTAVSADIVKDGRTVVRLQGQGEACRFVGA